MRKDQRIGFFDCTFFYSLSSSKHISRLNTFASKCIINASYVFPLPTKSKKTLWGLRYMPAPLDTQINGSLMLKTERSFNKQSLSCQREGNRLRWRDSATINQTSSLRSSIFILHRKGTPIAVCLFLYFVYVFNLDSFHCLSLIHI